MSKALVDRIPFAKILTVLASIFGIALGMCGLNLFLLRGGGSQSFLEGLGLLELVVMLGSVVGIVLTLVAWVVVGIASSFAHKNDDPQKLFDEDERQ